MWLNSVCVFQSTNDDRESETRIKTALLRVSPSSSFNAALQDTTSIETPNVRSWPQTPGDLVIQEHQQNSVVGTRCSAPLPPPRSRTSVALGVVRPATWPTAPAGIGCSVGRWLPTLLRLQALEQQPVGTPRYPACADDTQHLTKRNVTEAPTVFAYSSKFSHVESLLLYPCDFHSKSIVKCPLQHNLPPERTIPR